MASSLTSASTATKAVAAPFHHNKNGERKCTHSAVCFRLSHKPKFRICTKSRQNHSTVIRAQLKEVHDDGSSTAANTPPHTEVPDLEVKIPKPSKNLSSAILATEGSISEFINQVSSLVKLVDSRDIAELHLKQLDCEVVIRKKEALQPPPSSLPPTMIYSPSPPVVPPASPFPASASVPASSPVSSQASSVPAVTSTKSSFPPFKCPMAGMFYRSSAPGEPPFVKVGDKVTKGQVVCIIEAMKLMNEIEADQSGTIVEIIAEDGKPVSMDTPLFIIEP